MPKVIQSLKKKLQQKSHLTQFFSTIPSSMVTEIFTNQEIDTICFDTQHGQFNIESLKQNVSIAIKNKVIPLVRIPENQHLWCTQALDTGATGIICPLVNNKEECEHFVQSCLYPPLGNRSAGPFLAAIHKDKDYLAYANEEVVTLAMIETEEGVHNLDDILTTEHLGGIYVGPLDLSLTSTTLPPYAVPFSDELKSLILKIGEKTLAAGKIFAVHCPDPQHAEFFYLAGAQLCTVAADYALIIGASQAIIDQMNRS